MMIKLKQSILTTSILLVLTGCATTSEEQENSVTVNKSYLEDKNAVTLVENAEVVEQDRVANFIRLNQAKSTGIKLDDDLSDRFTIEKKYQISANELPLNEFLHYVLGDLLKVSYLIEPQVKENVSPVTLELKDKISGKRLFQLVQQVLEQNQVAIALNDEVFFVHGAAADVAQGNLAFGYGSDEKDVPFVSGDIMQMVPLAFGTSPGIRSTVMSLASVQVTLDTAQNLAILKGKRQQVLRAISIIQLLDSPAFMNKSMGLLSFQYIDSQSFIEKVEELLIQEGIRPGGKSLNGAVVHFVPIEHLGQVVVFATSDKILDRVEYWANQIDKPATGAEQSFFTYHPLYARATDLGASLAPLISGRSNAGGIASNSNIQTTAASGANRAVANSSGSSVQSIQGDNLKLVVDERSNSLIFYSTGKFYKELLPIISKLDVMPKQVMLEVVIAEVKLTGSYAQGVEYALSSGPSGSRNESFSFNSDNGFTYSVVGLDGKISLNLNQKDGLVNVLSRPTLLVRDGVSAKISVGDDIPTVGTTTTDPLNSERQTTTIQYRKTGVELSVTPTINAQGTVIMTISQNISNVSPDGLKIESSPSVFERSIETEVVAADGQSVMLGGLISENRSTNETAIPLLGDIPLFGNLFKSDAGSSDKTELVVLVTPRIISNASEWQKVRDSFNKGLDNIKF